ncbi:MAG: peroxiredoxin [Hyphomonadaceae bacterium]
MGATLKAGDPAPDFDLPTAGGGRISLQSLRKKPVVVYFYPKDDTPGCTQEALNFTERAADFAAAGAAIIGISPDSVSSHDKFTAKYGLQVLLAADDGHKTADDYGVWVEKNMYGRKYMGVERSTFLVAPDGKLARIWRKVKVNGHVEQVLESVKDL